MQIIHINNLLNQVKQKIITHKKYANKLGEDFNIFSILRMEGDEVGTHSRFIFELLNPNGCHGQGNIFLKSFARIVVDSKSPETTRNIKKEVLTDKGRRIDFTLETDKELVGIEMKIWAGDQNSQLLDYSKYLNKKSKNKYFKLLYLTLNGKKASENSLNGLTDDKYQTISFEVEIINWLEKCICLSAQKSVLREALIQYKILIEKLTGKNMTINNEITELLLKDNNIESAINISNAVTDAKIEIQWKFWQSLFNELEEKNCGYKIIEESKCTIEHVKSFYGKSRKNRFFGVRCAIDNPPKLEGGDELQLCIEIEWNIYYGLIVFNDKKQYDTETTKDLAETVQKDGFEKDEFSGKNYTNGKYSWLGWSYPYPKYNFETFLDDNIFKLADEKERNERVANLVDEINEKIEPLIDKLKKVDISKHINP